MRWQRLRPSTELRSVSVLAWGLAACLAVALVAGRVRAESFREQVEADWGRQDERRVAQIREPGLVRFASRDDLPRRGAEVEV